MSSVIKVQVQRYRDPTLSHQNNSHFRHVIFSFAVLSQRMEPSGSYMCHLLQRSVSACCIYGFCVVLTVHRIDCFLSISVPT
jgi:hypothetical protein